MYDYEGLDLLLSMICSNDFFTINNNQYNLNNYPDQKTLSEAQCITEIIILQLK